MHNTCTIVQILFERFHTNTREWTFSSCSSSLSRLHIHIKQRNSFVWRHFWLRGQLLSTLSSRFSRSIVSRFCKHLYCRYHQLIGDANKESVLSSIFLIFGPTYDKMLINYNLKQFFLLQKRTTESSFVFFAHYYKLSMSELLVKYDTIIVFI